VPPRGGSRQERSPDFAAPSGCRSREHSWCVSLYRTGHSIDFKNDPQSTPISPAPMALNSWKLSFSTATPHSTHRPSSCSTACRGFCGRLPRPSHFMAAFRS
jgi:hypothetical protein